MSAQLEEMTEDRRSRVDMLNFISKRFMHDKKLNPRDVRLASGDVAHFEIRDSGQAYVDVEIESLSCEPGCRRLLRVHVVSEEGSFALEPRLYEKGSGIVHYWWEELERKDYQSMQKRLRNRKMQTRSVPASMQSAWQEAVANDLADSADRVPDWQRYDAYRKRLAAVEVNEELPGLVAASEDVAVAGDYDLLWHRTMGGEKGDYLRAVVTGADGLITAAGMRLIPSTGRRGWLVRFTQNGDEVWNRICEPPPSVSLLRGPLTRDGQFSDMASVGDKFLVVGSIDTTRDYPFRYFDDDGWLWSLDEQDQPFVFSSELAGAAEPGQVNGMTHTLSEVDALSGLGSVAIGLEGYRKPHSTSLFGFDRSPWVVRFDERHLEMWRKHFNHSPEVRSLADVLLERSGYVLLAANLSNVPKMAALIHLDENGDEVWRHALEEHAGGSLAEVVALPDEKLLLRGGLRVPAPEGAKTVSWLGVADRSGRLIQQRTIAADDSLGLSDIAITMDGYIAVGEARDLATKRRYFVLLRLDKSLVVTARAVLTGNISTFPTLAVAPLPENRLVVVGARSVEGKATQGWVAVLAPKG